MNAVDPCLDTDRSPSAIAREAAQEPFMAVVRELVRAYQAFADYSAKHVRELGLTPPQFDVISALGNTSGMSMHRLAEKTLVTKGTLTGIIDRLETKNLVRREVPEGNRRSFTIVLTPKGQRTFEAVFPAHIMYLKTRFAGLDATELDAMQTKLRQLHELFENQS